MLHNDRKFVNSDPYQLSYFDIPPRLLVFYTAISYRLIRLLNVSRDCKYSVLLVPDFKQDIYVDSPTLNRDYDKELNLIIIHINEKACYDILDTIKAIAHEIAHHVGQSLDNRKFRGELYVKCCIATILKLYFTSYEYWNLVIGEHEDNYEIFDNLVEGIYTELKLQEGLKLNEDDEKERWYYTHPLIHEFVVYLDNLGKMKKDSVKDAFKKNLNNNKYYNENGYKKYFELENPILNFDNKVQNEYTEIFKRDRVSTILTEKFYDIVLDSRIFEVQFSNGKIIHPIFSDFIELFSEGMADVQMLSLMGDKHVHHDYCHENLATIRKNTVLNAFKVEDEAAPTNEKSLEFYEDPILMIHQKYICKKAIEYFNHVKIEDKSKDEEKILNMVKKLREAKTIKDLMAVIDREINWYLINLQDKEKTAYK